jgi:pimeloyl-ACP methyl ester carboxylesterase
MLECLEGRLFFSVDTSGVALFTPDGSPTAIDRHRAAWFIVHGAQQSKDLMGYMARAVAAASPPGAWQVIVVDWSQLANGTGSASKAALAVGDRVAAMINAARLPASRVNLIGFSMGGAVIGRIAADLKTKTTQVNRIVALDPANGRYGDSHYAANSAYSIAFSAGDDGYGDPEAALTADDTVLLTGLSRDMLTRHGDVFLVVQTMFRRDDHLTDSGNDHVSPLFSVQSILEGQQAAWKTNRYSGGYDAQMACGYQNGLPDDLGPMSMTYVDRRGKVRRVT